MAYRYTALIGYLLILVSCLDHDNIENEQRENYDLTVERWRQINRENLLESVTLLTEMTHKYLDGKVARTAWQHAWYQAHPRWLETTLLEFEADFQQIDAWPIAPGFLDSLDSYPQTGIVNDVSLDITSEVLHQQHQITKDTEVSLGFHVLEYYAFGRPETDLQEAEEANSRRRLLIRLVAEMLLLDVSQLNTNPKVQRKLLLKRLKIRSQTMLSEFNRVGEHGQFSNSSLINISVQLQAIETLMLEPVAFSNNLIALDTELTKVFNANLHEAIELVNNPSGLNVKDSSRLLLLLSALSHHLEDFVRLDEHLTELKD